MKTITITLMIFINVFFLSVFTLPHTNYFPSLQFNPRALISLLSNDEQLMISVILLFLSRPNCHVFHSKPFKFSILFRSVVFNLQSKKVRFQQNEKLLDLCFFTFNDHVLCFRFNKVISVYLLPSSPFFFTLVRDFESEKLEK